MALFTSARLSLLNGEINWLSGTIKCALVKNYSQNTAHVYLSSVTGAGGIVANATTLTGKGLVAATSPTSALYQASNVTMNSSPNDIANNYYLLLYQSSAPAGGADLATSAQRLIAYITSGTYMPIQPLGGIVSIAWGGYVLWVL